MDGGLVTGALIAGLASTAVDTVSTYQQAKQQNKNNALAAASEREASKIAAEERKASVAREAQLFEGSVRASSASRGAAGSASSLAIALSGVAQAERAGTNVNTQLANNVASINSRQNAQYVSPGISLFQSGLGGLNNTLGLVTTGVQLQKEFDT